MDRDYIESFSFPASFEDQKYSLDDVEYPLTPLEYGYEWAGLDKSVLSNPKVEFEALSFLNPTPNIELGEMPSLE